MAKPGATTLPPAAAPARDVLLATELHVPRPRPGFLSRPRLLELLGDGATRELTLVCAPAGFGKTTLLGDWARRSRRPVAWLSLDAGDNDPARFWRYVAAALDQVLPGTGERVAALLRGGAGPPPLEAVVTVLVNALAAQPDELALVLDDYHRIETPAIHHSLRLLLDRLPAQLRLVLAGRADPPLSLAALRARGQLTELRAAALRFRPQEAAVLLREVTEADLSEASVRALVTRTEGWAAGLQLAALSLHDRADPGGFVATFSGSHRYVLDYLTEEVLDRQPEETVRFLLETSVLERLCGPLGDAVTGRGDSQQVLEQLERRNLFLIPLDEVRGWWRYHHLFADLLRARLQQQQPERVPELHRAAAAWLQANGMVDEAIRHVLAAGDQLWAARLIEEHVDAFLVPGESATLQWWLAGLPAELVRSRPRLGLARTFVAVAGGDLEAAEAALDDAERALPGASEEPYQPSVGPGASLVANLPAAIALERAVLAHLRGDATQTIGFSSRALVGLGEGEWLLDSVIRWHLAVGGWLAGRLADAEPAFLASIAGWRAAGEPTLTAWGYHHLGQLQRAQGRLEAARGTYRQVLEVAATPDGPLPAAAIGHVGMAEVAYQRNQLEVATEQVTEGIRQGRQLGYRQPLATGLATLAWIRQATGDPAGALAAMGEAEAAGPSAGVTDLLNPVPVLAARLRLAAGDSAAAAAWAREHRLASGDRPDYPHERAYLLLARVLVAGDAAGQALELLEHLHALAVAQRRTGSAIEVRAVQALALAAAGDETAALAALTDAVALAAPEGHLRVFADEGPPMAALVGRLVTARRREPAAPGGAAAGYLGRLVRAFEPQGRAGERPGRPGTVAVPGLVEPLSARELEVLGYLAAGASNQQIADELVVALATVKKHVSHVLDKLGAANRTQAVTRARELGLLR